MCYLVFGEFGIFPQILLLSLRAFLTPLNQWKNKYNLPLQASYLSDHIQFLA